MPLFSREELRGAIARGYCHKPNKEKEVDTSLLEAIEEEVWKYLNEDRNETSG